MRAESAVSKLADIQPKYFNLWRTICTSYESTPQPRIAKAQSAELATPLQSCVWMPQDTNVQVLRHHGFDELADWAENPVLAPDYAWQSQYWASVLLAPVYRDWAEWEPRDAREFQFEDEDEAELPEADLPFLFPVFGVAAAVVSLNTTTNSPPLVPWEMLPHAEMRPNEPALGGGAGVRFLLNST